MRAFNCVKGVVEVVVALQGLICRLNAFSSCRFILCLPLHGLPKIIFLDLATFLGFCEDSDEEEEEEEEEEDDSIDFFC